MKPIPEGTSDEMIIETTPEMAARHMPVYSTPAMVHDFEGLCLSMLIPYLEPGENSVGYHIDVRHLAPTPIGMKVTIKARVKEVERRKVEFQVEAYNETGAKIGEGKHERRVVDMSRFAGQSTLKR